MTNPTLRKIIEIAVGELQKEYGTAALANGDNVAIINAFPEGKTIEIRITEKKDEP